jgi:superfamily I DNA and/or RNA helicase
VSVRLVECGVSDEGDHFHRLLQLLEMEAQAETRQALDRVQKLPPDQAEATGHCLAKLTIRDEYSGLGGRCVLTLTRKNADEPLPWTRLNVGTPVLLTAMGTRGSEGSRGVISEREETRLRVALNEPPEEDADLWRLDLAPDEGATLRQRDALNQARHSAKDRLAELRAVLLGEKAPEFEEEQEFAPLDSSLDASQRDAVRFALSAKDVAVIHGPPGTGKTTTVVELIRQCVLRGERVLVCAGSNLAVDNLLEKLLRAGEEPVRLGHPARVLPELREHSLDLLVAEHPDSRQARKLAKEAFALFRKASKWTRGRPAPGERRDARQEARALLADARHLESQAVEAVLNRARVVCSTLTALDASILGRRGFDLAVIDEACQTTEPGCWIPLLRCNRVVLAGDHCQLPPTVLSKEAVAQGFGVSLLERLVLLWGAEVTRRLNVQYRMHEAIMAFSSREFYDGSLVADDSVRTHLLRDLPGVGANDFTGSALQVIDTAGAGYDEEPEPDGESRLNPEEARLVRKKVEALLAAGLAPAQVGVITPYSAQVRKLRELLTIPGLEIDSVDGFQGREKEAIVVSLVRSNGDGEVGFLGDIRRTNVALTRARRKLIVVGDSATLSALDFYQRFFAYSEEATAYYTVWDGVEE